MKQKIFFLILLLINCCYTAQAQDAAARPTVEADSTITTYADQGVVIVIKNTPSCLTGVRGAVGTVIDSIQFHLDTVIVQIQNRLQLTPQEEDLYFIGDQNFENGIVKGETILQFGFTYLSKEVNEILIMKVKVFGPMPAIPEGKKFKADVDMKFVTYSTKKQKKTFWDIFRKKE